MRNRAAGVVILISILATGCGTGTPIATSMPSHSPGTTPSPTPFPTPYATQAAGLEAYVIPLGVDSAPIGIIYAEGSIWVALHHGDAVERIDPATGKIIARIPTGPRSGPAWFTIGDGSIWVTNQNGTGVSRINPATNTLSAAIGADPPCGPPAFFEHAVWIDACDTPALVRYDAATNAVAEKIDTSEPITPIAVGDQLWGVGALALYRIDAVTNDETKVLDCCGGSAIEGGVPAALDSELWTGQQTAALEVVDTRREKHAQTVPVARVSSMVFDRHSAWALSSDGGATLTEIDLSSYQPLEKYQFGVQLLSMAIVDGKLWITDFALSQIFVITPP